VKRHAVFLLTARRAQFERALVLLESASKPLQKPKEAAAHQRLRIEALEICWRST